MLFQLLLILNPIETKAGGKQYSAGIRMLYYTLLANQVPLAKISNIIKSIFECFWLYLKMMCWVYANRRDQYYLHCSQSYNSCAQ